MRIPWKNMIGQRTGEEFIPYVMADKEPIVR
jgi:hypothetical protein